MNQFVKVNTRGAGSALTENGAMSYATTGSELIDQFGKAGTARGREMGVVWTEQGTLWAEDALSALRFPFYLRLITRQVTLSDDKKTESVQKGQGARDEAFKRLLWIAKYHPTEFYQNLWVLPLVGSWKDLWVLMSMDDSLDRNQFFALIAEGINNDNSRDLVKKYMPRIRSEKKCTTEWAKKSNALAKAFANCVGWSYAEYRKFKSTGRAHEFQRIICKGLYSKINWNAIPGKALLNLVTGKFLGNHNLNDSYLKWLEKQPVAKFNGYPYELGMKLGSNYNYRSLSPVTKMTIDKQFANLIQTAQKDGKFKGNILCALDTSGSMTSPVNGGPNGLNSYTVGVSLGIYFSELNQGAFHNVVAMFDDESTMLTLKGSFSDKWYQITSQRDAMGGTNFQSVIDLLVKTRKNHPEIPLSEFPQTLLVVSDMQFNPVESSGWWSRPRQFTDAEVRTNYGESLRKLRTVFPEEFVEDFKFIWWNCAGRPTNDVPSTMDDNGTYLFSGFDGAVVNLLLGAEEKIDPITKEKRTPTMEEIVTEALSQEVLSLVTL